jgi:hypothetical protein
MRATTDHHGSRRVEEILRPVRTQTTPGRESIHSRKDPGGAEALSQHLTPSPYLAALGTRGGPVVKLWILWRDPHPTCGNLVEISHTPYTPLRPDEPCEGGSWENFHVDVFPMEDASDYTSTGVCSPCDRGTTPEGGRGRALSGLGYAE